MTGYLVMKATFFLLLTLFFGFSVFAAEDQAEKKRR